MEPGCEEELPGAVGLQRRGQGTILLLQGTARQFPAIHLSHTCPEEWVRWEYLQKVGKTPPFPAKITSTPLKWPVVVPMHRGATWGGDTPATLHVPLRCQIFSDLS